MSAEEALKSTNLKVVKVARSSVKKKISSAVASINVLAKDADEDFDHKNISRTNVLASHSKLETNLKLFKDLHEVYCNHRDKGENEASEEAILGKDEKYVTKTELTVHQALDIFTKHEKSFVAQEKAKAYQEIVEEEDRAKSKADEVKTKRWESDILKRELLVGGCIVLR